MTWQQHLDEAYTAAMAEEQLLRFDPELRMEATDVGMRALAAAAAELAKKAQKIADHTCIFNEDDFCRICGHDGKA